VTYHEDPRPTKHYDLTQDAILDMSVSRVLFRGSPEEIKKTLEEASVEYRDQVKIFEHRFVKIMTALEYLSVVDIQTNNTEFAPLPKRKWNQ